MSKFPCRDIINLDSDEETDDSYPFFNFLDPSPDSTPVLSDPEPDPHSCFIDFFSRESNEVDRTRESTSGDSNLCAMDDDIGLGLGAGSSSGSGSGSGSVPQVDEVNPQVIDFDFSIFDFSRIDAEIAIENSNIFVEEPEPPNVEEEDFSFILSTADLWQFLINDIGDDEIEFLFNGYEDDDAFVFDDDESVIRGSPPASKKVVEEIPDVVVTLRDGGIVCAICKDDVAVEEKVKRLPCRHYYHGECIVPWLGMRNTCPVCRYELPTDDAEYERSKKRQRRGLVTD